MNFLKKTIVIIFFSVCFAQNTLVVDGQGEYLPAANQVVLNFVLDKDGLTAAEAQELQRKEIKRLYDFLVTQDIEPENIKIENLQLLPIFNEKIDKVKPVAYKGSVEITVILHRYEGLGLLLDALTAADFLPVRKISYEITNEQNAKERALALALKDAESKAMFIAGGAGMKLGKPLNVKAFINKASRSGRALYIANVELVLDYTYATEKKESNFVQEPVITEQIIEELITSVNVEENSVVSLAPIIVTAN